LADEAKGIMPMLGGAGIGDVKTKNGASSHNLTVLDDKPNAEICLPPSETLREREKMKAN